MGTSRFGAAPERRGSVLPAVILSLAIMSVLAVVALRTADDERRSNRAYRESTGALYAGEAGLRRTLGNWPAGVAALTSGDSLDLGWQQLPNRAAYRTVIRRVDNGGLQAYAVTAQGRGSGLFGGQVRLTKTVTGVPVFKWGIFTQGDATLSGGAITDGYDSGNGPYDAAAADSTGSIFTNGSLSLSGGGTAIKGDATAVGTNAGGAVTGTRTAGAPAAPTPPNLACPAGGYTPAAEVPAIAHVSYNAGTGVLSVSSGTNLILPVPPTTYYFSSVTLAGNSTLTLGAVGQHVDVYIDNLLNLSGGTIVNTGAVPTDLGISACGSPGIPAGWTLSGGAGAYFSVYAPNHPITVSGNGDIFGSIIGASLTSSGGAKIHYDGALARQPVKNFATTPGSWAEFPN